MTTRTRNGLLTLGALAGAVLAIVGVPAVTAQALDRWYVRADSFAAHRARVEQLRAIDSIQREYDRRMMLAMRADLDTLKKCFRRPGLPECR